MEDLKSEAASCQAQLKILALLKAHNPKHSFQVNDTFDETTSQIKERALNVIESENNEEIKNKINKICSKSKLGKTTLYADFRADRKLHELWKKRVKSKIKTMEKAKQKEDTKIPKTTTEESQILEIEKNKLQHQDLSLIQDEFFSNPSLTEKALFSPYLGFEPEFKDDLSHT